MIYGDQWFSNQLSDLRMRIGFVANAAKDRMLSDEGLADLEVERDRLSAIYDRQVGMREASGPQAKRVA